MLEPDFDVVGTINDGTALLEAASRMKPDVCLMDISLPGMSGIEAATRLKEGGSEAKLVFLTVHEDPDYVRAAIVAGASGYVVKSRMASDLELAIREAVAGRFFVSPSVPYVTQNGQCEETS